MALLNKNGLGIMRKHGVGAYWNHDFTRLHFNSADFADAMAKEKEKSQQRTTVIRVNGKGQG